MIYNNDKAQTQDLKKFLKPQSPGKAQGVQPKERKGTVGAPSNRILPIRGGSL